MNIPTAEEAKRIIESGEYQKAEEQRVKIEALLKASLESGRRIFSIYEEIIPSIKLELEQLGYAVQIGVDKNEDYFVVSW